MLLSLLRRSLAYSPRVHPCRRASFLPASRGISTSPARGSSLTPDPPSPEEEAESQEATPPPDSELDFEEDAAGDEPQRISLRSFMATIGLQYKYAKPNNWLGGDVPFPMNPTFRPPPPFPDAMRQEIYNRYMSDPVENSVRKLALRYTISPKRVDAILRLKGLEHSWYKDKQIQYGFQKGMEKLLGVKPHRLNRIQEGIPRWDVMEADSLEQDENRDAQRQRHQHNYWESVPEDGREPIVPASLEHARNLAQKLVKVEDHQKSTHPLLMPRFKRTSHFRNPKRKLRILESPDRPAVEIRDVAGKFLDVQDRLEQIIVAHRRARKNEKKQWKQQANEGKSK